MPNFRPGKLRHVMGLPQEEAEEHDEVSSDPSIMQRIGGLGQRFIQAHEDANRSIDDFSSEHGLPRGDDEIDPGGLLGLTWNDVQGAGSIGGTLVKAPTAAKGLALAAKELPNDLGNIIQVIKEKAPEAAKKFGKITFRP